VLRFNPDAAGSLGGIQFERDVLIGKIRNGEIACVLVDPEGLRPGRLDALMADLWETPAEIRKVANNAEDSASAGELLAGTPVPQCRVRARPLAGWGWIAKRSEDIFIAGLMLLILAPLMLLIAAAIRIETPGPALFRQIRYGYNNRRIQVLKFRTMHHDMQDAHGALQVQHNDERVTRLGRFLRLLSIDELPQLLNVLGGTMSIVGPRPHALESRAGGMLFEHAVPGYAARHNVKPGITGFAQINGWRGPAETVDHLAKRVELDLHYIRDWSLLLDFVILVKTIPAIIGQKNAC
jgi:exopolysaccharide biosynthesis polyprenyl glycosylphosphotransferase